MFKREPGLDLLRCIAFLFVVTFHSFLNNGYYIEPQVGIVMWLSGSFRWLSVSCIGLFLMLTGYLKSEKTGIKACYRGLFPVLLGYLIAAVISIPIRHFVLGDAQSLSTWLSRLFRFRAVLYGWYVEMYFGLVLLMPFVNLVLSHLRTAKQLLLLSGILLFLTALPGATPLPMVSSYWEDIYPLTYYVLGAVIRRLQPKIKPWIGIVLAVSMSFLLGAATVLSTDGKLSEALTWEFADLWIAVIAVCLFTALYNLQLSAAFARVFAFASGGCYGGYLLSHLLDAWCYSIVPEWSTPEKYPLVFLCITIPIFLVSILCGKLLQGLTDRLLCFGKRYLKFLRRKNLIDTKTG